MKRSAPSPLLGLLLAPVALLFALWHVRGQVDALPGWTWGWVLLTGLAGLVGALPIRQVTPERPFSVQAGLLGGGFGLMYITLMSGEYALRGEPVTIFLVTIWIVGALLFGVVMVKLFRPGR